MTRKSQISESFKNRNVPGKPWWSPTLSCHPCDPPAEKPELEVKALITGGKTGLAYFSAPAGTARPRRDLCGEGHGCRRPIARVRVLALGLQRRRPQLPDVSEAVFLSVRGVTRPHRGVLGKISGGVFTKCMALSEVRRKRLITERWLLSGGPAGQAGSQLGMQGQCGLQKCGRLRQGSVRGPASAILLCGILAGSSESQRPCCVQCPGLCGRLDKGSIRASSLLWRQQEELLAAGQPPRACPPRAPGRQRGRRRGWG